MWLSTILLGISGSVVGGAIAMALGAGLYAPAGWILSIGAMVPLAVAGAPHHGQKISGQQIARVPHSASKRCQSRSSVRHPAASCEYLAQHLQERGRREGLGKNAWTLPDMTSVTLLRSAKPLIATMRTALSNRCSARIVVVPSITGLIMSVTTTRIAPGAARTPPRPRPRRSPPAHDCRVSPTSPW